MWFLGQKIQDNLVSPNSQDMSSAEKLLQHLLHQGIILFLRLTTVKTKFTKMQVYFLRRRKQKKAQEKMMMTKKTSPMFL